MGNATHSPQTPGSPGVPPDVQLFTDCSDSGPSPNSPIPFIRQVTLINEVKKNRINLRTVRTQAQVQRVQLFTDCSDSSPSPKSPIIHGLFGLKTKSKESNYSRTVRTQARVQTVQRPSCTINNYVYWLSGLLYLS